MEPIIIHKQNIIPPPPPSTSIRLSYVTKSSLRSPCVTVVRVVTANKI